MDSARYAEVMRCIGQLEGIATVLESTKSFQNIAATIDANCADLAACIYDEFQKEADE